MLYNLMNVIKCKYEKEKKCANKNHCAHPFDSIIFTLMTSHIYCGINVYYQKQNLAVRSNRKKNKSMNITNK